MSPHAPVLDAVFTHDAIGPVGRYVHLTLALLADEHGHVETTVHTLEHLTGLQSPAIEAALGFNTHNLPLFAGTVTLAQGVVTADLPKAA